MSDRGTVVTIGNFDGVHIGHRALLSRARGLAGSGEGALRIVALAFDPHPLSVLRPGAEPSRLTTYEDRARLLREAGADAVERLEPSPDLLGKSPEEFVGWLVDRFAPAAVVEGVDFRFGKGRAGDVRLLAGLGERHGFGVEVVEPVEAVLTDQTVVAASSSMARWLILHGRVRDAAAVLGREYEVSGEVVRGDRRGREIGMPTANVRTGCVLPADGVYAGWGTLPDGRRVPAAISVGTKPMFDGGERALEAHLLDLGEGGGVVIPIPGLPEYGWTLRLTVTSWVRDQARFESVEALLEQMKRDCARVREVLGPGCAFQPCAAGAGS